MLIDVFVKVFRKFSNFLNQLFNQTLMVQHHALTIAVVKLAVAIETPFRHYAGGHWLIEDGTLFRLHQISPAEVGRLQ